MGYRWHILCTGLAALLMTAFCFGAVRPESMAASAEGVLRLHVIANSNSAEDQRVKYLVRDALVERFLPEPTIEDAKAAVLVDGGQMQALVNRVLEENGCSYGAQLLFGPCTFPERTYGDTVYPAGEYEALRVVLGEGAGENWWCVLFPPLCLLDIGVEDLPGTDDVQVESAILNWLKGK